MGESEDDDDAVDAMEVVGADMMSNDDADGDNGELLS